jgi:iron complex transport system ATP-binding protein
MATLSFRQLSIGYTVSRRQHAVVDDLTGVFPAATLTCLVGRNGTGKSTLLRTLAGLQQPLVGSVLIDDTPLSNLSAIERARLIGVVLTQRLEVQNLTVREVVAMGRSPYTGFFGTLSKADWEVVDEALRQVGMSPWADRYVQMLSDGERQKVMIAKALAQQTPVLVLDEPTAFLDYPSKVEMMKLLCRLAKEMDKTIVLSTHDIELAAKIATRFLLLSENGLQEVQASEILMSFSF